MSNHSKQRTWTEEDDKELTEILDGVYQRAIPEALASKMIKKLFSSQSTKEECTVHDMNFGTTCINCGLTPTPIPSEQSTQESCNCKHASNGMTISTWCPIHGDHSQTLPELEEIRTLSMGKVSQSGWFGEDVEFEFLNRKGTEQVRAKLNELIKRVNKLSKGEK
jgi:hypothetical protein